MAEDKTGRNVSKPANTSKETELSDEIARVVGFLDSRRSEKNDRAAELASELAHRREVAARNAMLSQSIAAGREAASVEAGGVQPPSRPPEQAAASRPVLRSRFRPEPQSVTQSVPEPSQPAAVAADPPRPASPPAALRPRVGNPEFAVRYHTFCQDLDELLDGFRARVTRSKPVQH